MKILKSTSMEKLVKSFYMSCKLRCEKFLLLLYSFRTNFKKLNKMKIMKCISMISCS